MFSVGWALLRRYTVLQKRHILMQSRSLLWHRFCILARRRCVMPRARCILLLLSLALSCCVCCVLLHSATQVMFAAQTRLLHSGPLSAALSMRSAALLPSIAQACSPGATSSSLTTEKTWAPQDDQNQHRVNSHGCPCLTVASDVIRAIIFRGMGTLTHTDTFAISHHNYFGPLYVPTGQPIHGPLQVARMPRLIQHKSVWGGLEWAGMRWNWVVWSGVGWSGVERGGVGWRGVWQDEGGRQKH